ncbi:acetyl-CoA C-acyltransferase [Ammoniphilus resinae]|uniref:acetyl-CoA C-acyltransferase n=1 Tax=Ammoniphilus resinae TaxID=861532 RepID=A0ABS4GK13_9BACL|nr:acetyl-CoA C-acyltransferase [Ammoniphilus resinae]MBP1930605.1 acetyl-CoA acyltransferase [Ammoniphilus resinae]
MKEAVIVSGVRTAVGKSAKGSLCHVRPEDLGGLVVKESIKRVKGLSAGQIDDVIIGCAMPEGEQGLNLGRIVAIRAGLPATVPGLVVNRFCASGLQAIAFAAERIICGSAKVIVAGGVESMSHVPMTGYKPLPNPYLVEHYPQIYCSMGHTAEQVARKYGISREEQDFFAAASHQKAARAIQRGNFKNEIVPVEVVHKSVGDNGKLEIIKTIFDTDEGIRANTTPEILAKLKPAFHLNGTVTAGNASQTSDGAAAVVVMSKEKADQMGLHAMAVFRSFAVTGVDPELMGLGPVTAIPRALQLAGIEKNQVDLFEINEAFASQCKSVIDQLELDNEKVNVNGGAIALGHPLGCTGAKLTVSMLYEARRRNSRYGIVSMCVGGGMGAAAVLEF